jgi:polar amino acid transport system substrate-binding protein
MRAVVSWVGTAVRSQIRREITMKGYDRKTWRALLAGGCLAAACFTLAQSPVRADATLDRIHDRGSVAIGVMVNSPPYGYVDQQTRQLKGFNIDLAQELASRLGAKPTLVEVTPPNRVQFLQQGKVDLLIANMQWTQERSEILGFVPTPYDESGGAPVARKDSHIQRWEDLRGKKVCVSQGSSYAKPLAEEYGAEVAGYPGMPESLLALRGGNCVAAVHDGAPVRLMVVDNPDWADYEVPIGADIASSPSVIWLRKGETDIQVKLDAALKDLHRSGWLLEAAARNRLKSGTILQSLHDKALAGQL